MRRQQDGIVDDNEKQVYDKMLAADLDKDGFLTRVEVFKVISAFHSELKSVSAAGIPIESLNPDTDGDGQVRTRPIRPTAGHLQRLPSPHIISLYLPRFAKLRH